MSEFSVVFFLWWNLILNAKVFPRLDGGATYVDSDTGLESMSSAEATNKACDRCLDGAAGQTSLITINEMGKQMDTIKQEVTRLKCDKLDLLRQNVVSWSDLMGIVMAANHVEGDTIQLFSFNEANN